ncbi:phospholipase A2 inhibitor and Ly6/PLAUR domain-containing protein-like [Eublepharis macularius]|uniref:Phospholipase A2 inhibitor and Ly6/PLAUR domain-containing protein-like n=1 Tax=Eublepharis macularius TaxID=481883 RepID=A0AA97LK38_EUBMA|nr:phospholipase A2 inhibitor and Ly6/PLAUR domain-containing protein-like [Eublepharis macularius]
MQTCLIFSILSALVDAVDLLACEDCSRPGQVCDGEMRPCFLGEDTCGSILGETNLGTEASLGILKSCTEYRACKAGVRTMTVGAQVTLRRSALCCQGESCRNESVILPQENTVLNGFSCPACYVKDSDSCVAESMLVCTGSENHCIYVTGTLEKLQGITATSTTFAAKGCATKSACESRQGMSAYSGGYSYTISTIKECYPAPISTNSAYAHDDSWMEPVSLDLITISVMSTFYFLFCAAFV